MTTAAALIIGEEILGATFEDENGPWLRRWLRGRGLELRRLVYLPDDRALIAEELARLTPSHDWVFTSGGGGPTHDDVTFEAVAEAVGCGIRRHPELVRVLQRRLGDRFHEGALRMCDVPEDAQLWWDGEIEYPVVAVANVVILPGIPSLFRAKLDDVAHRFEGRLPQQRTVRCTLHESYFAAELEALAERHPAVRIGSYPRSGDDQPWRVQLILEGHEPEALERCEGELRALLGDAALEREDPLSQP